MSTENVKVERRAAKLNPKALRAALLVVAEGTAARRRKIGAQATRMMRLSLPIRTPSARPPRLQA